MNQQNTIRWAVAADIEVLEHLEQQCYADHANNHKQLLAILCEPPCGTLVATIASQIIGYLIFRVQSQNHQMLILRLGVCPLHRRLGWARSLIAKAEEQIRYHRRRGIWRVSSVVHERNVAAQLLARSAGYQVSQVLQAFFDPDDAYVFERKVWRTGTNSQYRNQSLAQN